jgi:hypothetical protein
MQVAEKMVGWQKRLGEYPTSSATKLKAALELETTSNLFRRHSLYPGSSQCTELSAKRSARPLGSTSTNKATVCETVVSAVGDYFRVARHPPGMRQPRLHFNKSPCFTRSLILFTLLKSSIGFPSRTRKFAS